MVITYGIQDAIACKWLQEFHNTYKTNIMSNAWSNNPKWNVSPFLESWQQEEEKAFMREVGVWRKLVSRIFCADMDVDGWKEVTLIHNN